MVKKQDKDNEKRQGNQGKAGCPAKASKIGYSTPYSYCSERLSPFGGLFGLVKFMELIQFKEIFEGLYNPPSRPPAMGHHSMVGETMGGEEVGEVIRWKLYPSILPLMRNVL